MGSGLISLVRRQGCWGHKSSGRVRVLENGREIQQQRTLRGETGHGGSAQFKVGVCCLSVIRLLWVIAWTFLPSSQIPVVHMLHLVDLRPQHQLKQKIHLMIILSILWTDYLFALYPSQLPSTRGDIFKLPVVSKLQLYLIYNNVKERKKQANPPIWEAGASECWEITLMINGFKSVQNAMVVQNLLIGHLFFLCQPLPVLIYFSMSFSSSG